MQSPVKDMDGEHLVADAWRPTLTAIVQAFVERDYDLVRGIPFVEPIPPKTAAHIRTYVADYGETLSELPPEAWKTSVSSWGVEHWDVLVDLWTLESGRSDMVLQVRVREVDDQFRFEVYLVYVP